MIDKQIEKPNQDLAHDLELPYISTYQFKAKIFNDENCIIPLYATDYNQSEYYSYDNSHKFTLKVEINENVKLYSIGSGDYNLDLGILKEGHHDICLSIIDKNGKSSHVLYYEIWVVDRITYPITKEQTCIVTEDMLKEYGINNKDSQVVSDMIGNRVNLSRLFKDLATEGYRKCVLPKGTYRVNRCLRRGTGENTPISIASGLTVDMNGSTFKMHPYNDLEYGEIGKVENLLVMFMDCIDSHLINGTLEGDYKERTENEWLSNFNGEGSNGVTMLGGKHNTIENLTVTQITGYNFCTNFGNGVGRGTALTPWSDNRGLDINTKEEIVKSGRCISNYSDITSLIPNKLFSASIWLAMGGLKGYHWYFDIHFYDENKEFIRTTKNMQFRSCYIPKGAKYVRVEAIGTGYQMTVGNGMGLHSQPSPKYCEVKNCEYIDNRTCIVPGQSVHISFTNVNFTRSGHSIAPCAMDFEDGWEQLQDVYLTDCEIKEKSGTAQLIANSGLNIVMERCKNWHVITRKRVHGLTIRNCELSLNNTIGWMSQNTQRFYNNKITGLSCSVTDASIKNKVKLINNEIELGYIDRLSRDNFTVEKCKVTLGGTHYNININDCDIIHKGGASYIGGNVFIANSKVKGIETEPKTKFSFNASKAIRQYTNNVYDMPILMANHNGFDSAFFKGCTFNKEIEISTNRVNEFGDIVFAGCKFNDNIVIDLKGEAKVLFEGCNIDLNKVIFKNGKLDVNVKITE